MMNCPLDQNLVIMNVLLGKILSSDAEGLNVANFFVKSNIQHLLKLVMNEENVIFYDEQKIDGKSSD